MFNRKTIIILLVSAFTVGSIHAGLFSSKVPKSKIIEDAIAPFCITGTKGRRPQCTYAPHRGNFEVEILNRYNRKIDGEDWQCVEVKVTFTGGDTWSSQQSIRVFRFEYAYIQRGNRWERKKIGQIDYCLNEWKYAKIDPSKQEQVDLFSQEVYGFIARYDYPPKEIGVPYRTNSPSYPYEVGITLKVNTRGGKPYRNNVHLVLRFSALEEAWKLSAEMTIDPR